MAISVEVMLDERGYGKLCDMGSGRSDQLASFIGFSMVLLF